MSVDLTEADFFSVRPDKVSLVHQFFSDSFQGKRFLLGRNEHAVSLLGATDISGIVDDFYLDDEWQGKPVIKADSLPAGAIVVNCSTSISPVAASKRLQALGDRILGYCSFGDVFNTRPDLLDAPDFVKSTRDDYLNHKDEWRSLHRGLKDDLSKKTLEDVLRYRVSSCLDTMADYDIRLKDQYFEDFLNLTPTETFVDGGGFDGDTTEQLFLRTGGLKRSYFFEPSVQNIDKAKTRLSNVNDVVYMPFGLSDKRGSLHFCSDSGSSSKIDENGETIIEVTSLDEMLDEPVTFIKFDIEGSEMAALNGSRRHITADRPKMAIAVYHKASDFRTVYSFVTSIHSDYDVYLRHYTQGWSETVMFFC